MKEIDFIFGVAILFFVLCGFGGMYLTKKKVTRKAPYFFVFIITFLIYQR
jgi:hypothetical protein